MNILSLDSSSPVASVALLSITEGGSEILFREDTPHARSDSSALFIALEKAVVACGAPEALCVGLGPGSYNGLRAGIAAARGFATMRSPPLWRCRGRTRDYGPWVMPVADATGSPACVVELSLKSRGYFPRKRLSLMPSRDRIFPFLPARRWPDLRPSPWPPPVRHGLQYSRKRTTPYTLSL